MFWEQARLAEGRPHIDALEAYYLCVMLGFRGQYLGKPQDLQQWRQRVQARLVAELTRLKKRDELRSRPLNPNRKPLTGYRIFDRMRAALVVLAALATLAGSFALFRALLPH
jgi:type VI secretion system protein ImpK